MVLTKDLFPFFRTSKAKVVEGRVKSPPVGPRIVSSSLRRLSGRSEGALVKGKGSFLCAGSAI